MKKRIEKALDRVLWVLANRTNTAGRVLKALSLAVLAGTVLGFGLGTWAAG